MDKNLMARGHVCWRPVTLRRLALGLFLLALAPLAARAQQPWWKTNMELVGDLAVGNPIDLDITGSRAYLKCFYQRMTVIDYVVVADVANPRAPRTIGIWYSPSPLKDVAVAGNIAIGIYDNSQTILHIFDITDPSAAKELTTIDMVAHSYHIATVGNLAVVTSYDNSPDKPHFLFTILDLSNPAAPKILSQQHVPSGNYLQGIMQINGNRLFLEASDRIYVYDITDPAAPRQLANFSNGGVYCSCLRVEGKYLFIGTADRTIKVYDWSLPDNQNNLGSFQVSNDRSTGESYHFDVIGMKAFVSNELMVEALDLSALYSSDSLRGNYRMPTKPAAVKVQGGYIYIALADRGLSILRYTGPDAAVQILGDPNPQTVWTRGAQATVNWKTNVATAGTAVRMELWRAGAKVQDLCVSWNANGCVNQPFTVPANLTPGNDYMVRIVSVWDPKLWAEAGPITVK